jgi:hypothetical protein
MLIRSVLKAVNQSKIEKLSSMPIRREAKPLLKSQKKSTKLNHPNLENHLRRVRLHLKAFITLKVMTMMSGQH